MSFTYHLNDHHFSQCHNLLKLQAVSRLVTLLCLLYKEIKRIFRDALLLVTISSRSELRRRLRGIIHKSWQTTTCLSPGKLVVRSSWFYFFFTFNNQLVCLLFNKNTFLLNSSCNSRLFIGRIRTILAWRGLTILMKWKLFFRWQKLWKAVIEY